MKEFSGKKVLLVDDDLINLQVVEKIMGNWQVEVVKCVDSRTVLSLLEQTNPDLVLMDVQMPEVDGFQATKQIRSALLDIPIVALTASEKEEIENQVKESGMNDVLIKPFAPQELHDLLIKFFGE